VDAYTCGTPCSSRCTVTSPASPGTFCVPEVSGSGLRTVTTVKVTVATRASATTTAIPTTPRRRRERGPGTGSSSPASLGGRVSSGSFAEGRSLADTQARLPSAYDWHSHHLSASPTRRTRAHLRLPVRRLRPRLRHPPGVHRRLADGLPGVLRAAAQAVRLGGRDLQGFRLLPDRLAQRVEELG